MIIEEVELRFEVRIHSVVVDLDGILELRPKDLRLSVRGRVFVERHFEVLDNKVLLASRGRESIFFDLIRYPFVLLEKIGNARFQLRRFDFLGLRLILVHVVL